MLCNKHDCYSILADLENSGNDVSAELYEVMHNSTVPKKVVKELINRNDAVCSFYLNLNNKAHKIIKEVLTCEGKSVSTYIKIASSIITQGTITMEHLYESDISGQNNFIDCLGLKQLSEGMNIFFNTGDYTPLVEAVNQNRIDVKTLLDSRE